MANIALRGNYPKSGKIIVGHLHGRTVFRKCMTYGRPSFASFKTGFRAAKIIMEDSSSRGIQVSRINQRPLLNYAAHHASLILNKYLVLLRRLIFGRPKFHSDQGTLTRAVPHQGTVSTNYAPTEPYETWIRTTRSVEIAAHIKGFKIALTPACGILVKNILVRRTATFWTYLFGVCKDFSKCQIKLSAECTVSSIAMRTVPGAQHYHCVACLPAAFQLQPLTRQEHLVPMPRR
ncbi:hypothetical protein F5146DRAFT_1002515 [Armillaria mellea]|nr:hypothetical protein F5146DRAFT_1002515 [Armillaria mellea]